MPRFSIRRSPAQFQAVIVAATAGSERLAHGRVDRRRKLRSGGLCGRCRGRGARADERGQNEDAGEQGERERSLPTPWAMR
jgi:hypothetical protein